MRAKPQLRQHFSFIFLKIAKAVLRAVPGLRHFSALRFWGLRYFCACMRAKPQYRQHFILTLLDIHAHVSARSVSDSFFRFFFLSFFPAGSCEFWIFVACLRAKPQFRQHFIFTLFHIRAHGSARSVSDSFLFALFILSCCRSRVLWVLDFSRVHAPATAVLAPVTPEFDFPSCSKSLRSPENPCPKHNNVRVPRAYGDQSLHAQTIIPFVFQGHTVTRASMPKP